MDDNNDWGALSGLPGNPMMWVLILSELVVFGAFILGFAGARLADPVLFADSQSQLDRLYGGLNTLVLVTSGWMAALAVRSRMDGQVRAARVWLVLAAVLGIVFIIIKGFEYNDKFVLDLGMETNTFWTLYFLMTGFHAAHVVLGLVLLGVAMVWTEVETLETCTAFWHMVDMIWVLLYPVIYLIH